MEIYTKKNIENFEKDSKLLRDLGYGCVGFNCQGKPRKSDIERNKIAIDKFKMLKGK